MVPAKYHTQEGLDPPSEVSFVELFALKLQAKKTYRLSAEMYDERGDGHLGKDILDYHKRQKHLYILLQCW